MRKNTKSGAVALPIIIPVLVIALMLGIFILNKEEKEISKGDFKQTIETNNIDDSLVNNSPGSYEEYSPEKIALAKDKKVVIFFYAAWCPTCRAHESSIEANLDSIPSDVVILKANYDKETELKKRYGVRFQHSFVHVDENGEALAKWVNGRTVDDIISKLK